MNGKRRKETGGARGLGLQAGAALQPDLPGIISSYAQLWLPGCRQGLSSGVDSHALPSSLGWEPLLRSELVALGDAVFGTSVPGREDLVRVGRGVAQE